jgi:lipopolysaccharide export system permease protein
MIRKIDRYIIRKFLGTFFYSIALIMVIVIIFDISEHIDDFVEKDPPLSAIVFDYYLNFIPYFANLFSPLFTFIAVIFFTSRMAANTEIVAILSSGISFRRLLVPFMLSAAFIAIMSFCLSNYVIPHANLRRLRFDNTYIRNHFRNNDVNIHRQVSPGIFVYFDNFNDLDNIGYKFAYQKMNKGKMYYKIMAEEAHYDSTTLKWELKNYNIRYIEDEKELLKVGAKLDTAFAFKPDEFSDKTDNIETMNYWELDRFIESEKLKGVDNLEYCYIEKYKRISFPFATFILTLIGVSMASRKVRGGIGLHIGMGLLISFSYILFMQISTTFATNGSMSPFWAVWTPNILYMVIALFLLRLAPK